MNLNHYIFITGEGSTFEPNDNELRQDIENLQVIGFSDGNSPEEAFQNLLIDAKYLTDTSFNEIKCYKLNSIEEVTHFNLKD